MVVRAPSILASIYEISSILCSNSEAEASLTSSVPSTIPLQTLESFIARTRPPDHSCRGLIWRVNYSAELKMALGISLGRTLFKYVWGG